MQDSPHGFRLMAWLKVFRLPNLFTVPGDPVAGYLLALSVAPPSWMDMGLCAVSSLLLYMAGLASNDYFDLAEDRRDRPDRPLPSGAVQPGAALAAAAILAAAGLAFAAAASTWSLGVAVILTACIAAYNMRLKRHRVIGSLAMGLCRGLSLLLGAAAAAAAGEPVAGGGVLVAAGGLIVYIMAVTAIAAGETTRQRLPVRRWIPAGAMLATIGALILLRSSAVGREGVSLVVASVCALVTVWVPLACGWRLGGEPKPGVVARTIGVFIRVLIPYQATLMAWSGFTGWIAAVIFLTLWPLAALAARRFYAS